VSGEDSVESGAHQPPARNIRLGHQAHNGLQAMDIEVVPHRMPNGVARAACTQGGAIVQEVFLVRVWPTR
jgi:hypothetical protein